METDFLNFHDEEHFGSALYQNELLDDSQSSLLDIVGDGYIRRDSSEYGDNSIIWEQDVEQELNGDVAVIPMSRHINSFPKLSNSPPSKDFQKIFSDWHHLTSIEAAPSDDLTSDFSLNNQGMGVADMLDYLPPVTLAPVEQQKQQTIPESNVETPVIVTAATRKSGGKNLELLKQVVKEEIDLDSSFKSFKSEIVSSDELELEGDVFDITSYVNGDDQKGESKVKRKGCYEKTMKVDNVKLEIDDDDDDGKIEVEDVKIKIEDVRTIKNEPEEDDDDDDEEEEESIDVETVSEQMPVLQARDVISLWAQFEANEAANPSHNNITVEEKPENTDLKPPTTTTSLSPNKIKQLNPELKQPIQKPQVLSIELIQKMKASNTKKPISVIPAMPTKKSRGTRIQDAAAQLTRNKILKICCNNESIQLDHDYCTVLSSPNKNSGGTSRRSSSDSAEEKYDNSEVKKNLGTVIDDTAIRIGKQIKNAINNENAIKQKLIMCRNQDQSTNKNQDGKVMISLLKPNIRNVNVNNNNNTNMIVNTVNTNCKQVKNIIVHNDASNNELKHQQNVKKRKLNLEEYKKLRGDIIKTNSCDNSPRNSGSNSPMTLGPQKEVKYQELIMKMASEILKTNAKSKQQVAMSDQKLDEFIPPDVVSNKKSPQLPFPEPIDSNVVGKPLKENYEIRTYVSIGTNTENSFLQIQNRSKDDLLSPPKKDSDNSKLTQIITPILQNAGDKINSNSLITNITATLLQVQQTPKLNNKNPKEIPQHQQHGEDKTVIIINNKDKESPKMKSQQTQTDDYITEEKLVKQYRVRRDSSASSSTSITSNCIITRMNSSSTSSALQTRNNTISHNSSSNSISSSLGSRWSRSRSRSHSRSTSESDYSSYRSDSSRSRSRSRSRSVSPVRRWHSHRNSRSCHRYSRSRRRSSSNSYRNSYRHSRSPYSRSRTRRGDRDRDLTDKERMREVEERRVVYVGKLSKDTTKADLRQRFHSFGPITNISVHFRDLGDNYGFVTFQHKIDAYEAVEHGNDDPHMPKYDISFGGRRAFCKTRYSDLDNIDDNSFNTSTLIRRQEGSFDILLREVQAKLLKRKV